MNWQPVSVTSACQFCRPLLRLSCWTSTSSWCHGRFYNWWLFVTSYVIGCCFWSIFCKLNKSEFVALCADESVIYLLRLINLAGGGRVHSDVRLINSLPWICINEKDKREAERYANIIMTHKCNYRAIKGEVRMQIHAKKKNIYWLHIKLFSLFKYNSDEEASTAFSAAHFSLVQRAESHNNELYTHIKLIMYKC